MAQYLVPRFHVVPVMAGLLTAAFVRDGYRGGG